MGVTSDSSDSSTVNSRFPELASTPVSALVESPGLPVIVGRVMCWPHGSSYEARLAAGATATSKRWGFASAFTTDGQRATYVQIANTEAVESVATVTVYDRPQSWRQQIPLAPNSRTTVDLRDVVPPVSAFDARDFAVIVTSSTTDIGVERSMYGTPTNGPFWAAGATALATRLPSRHARGVRYGRARTCRFARIGGAVRSWFNVIHAAPRSPSHRSHSPPAPAASCPRPSSCKANGVSARR